MQGWPHVFWAGQARLRPVAAGCMCLAGWARTQCNIASSQTPAGAEPAAARVAAGHEVARIKGLQGAQGLRDTMAASLAAPWLRAFTKGGHCRASALTRAPATAAPPSPASGRPE